MSMNARCVICGEKIIPHRYCKKKRKTCYRPDCIRDYTNQCASVNDIRRRKAERAIDELNGKEMISCAVCGDRFTIIQHTHLKRHGLTIAQYRKLYPSAPLMTDEVRATRGMGSLIQSRYLTYSGKEPDSNLFEFLTGALLGDGCLEKHTGKLNARYAEGGNNEFYIKWKHDFLSQYFQCSFKERISAPHSKSGKCYRGWWIRTTVHPLLTQWHTEWYKEHKIVPQSIVKQYLTEFALAVWFCDDGCSTNGANLYTMAFSQEEVIFLSDLLLSKFDLANSILKNKQGQFLIRFRAAASRQLKEMIAVFSIPGMAYKTKK
jgi:LAGLIDADG DNA endonuclease family